MFIAANDFDKLCAFVLKAKKINFQVKIGPILGTFTSGLL